MFNIFIKIFLKNNQNVQNEEFVNCNENTLPIKKVVYLDQNCNNIDFQIMPEDVFPDIYIVMLLSFLKTNIIVKKRKIVLYLKDLKFDYYEEDDGLDCHKFHQNNLNKNYDTMVVNILPYSENF